MSERLHINNLFMIGICDTVMDNFSLIRVPNPHLAIFVSWNKKWIIFGEFKTGTQLCARKVTCWCVVSPTAPIPQFDAPIIRSGDHLVRIVRKSTTKNPTWMIRLIYLLKRVRRRIAISSHFKKINNILIVTHCHNIGSLSCPNLGNLSRKSARSCFIQRSTIVDF